MIKINDGGPAFPLLEGQDTDMLLRGMSLRDYFAGQALMGMAACPEQGEVLPVSEWCMTDFAKAAYRCADAMLAEREKS
jgi:hypothetical protein